ncbi:hypothetical protein INT43_004244 [Umbelopsis isabellina]|uniref:C2 NT-type domain-containing protein n=1 Tax=Mortierella isabellina TaxID=91625 RepID=A0A8H7PI14_MORIS|nr:hypothetical protein INT43_004244 [Umbelopsis isabellina]
MLISQLFISKSRKIDFELSILFQDLANVPLVSGNYYIKWKIKYADAPSGSTARAPITDHNVLWNHTNATTVHLIVGKDNILAPCDLKLEVFQELNGGKDTHTIGTLTLNLSEYAGSGTTTRRYLLDDCKFNSTLKLSIRLFQKSDADIKYEVPPLKKQQIFADIPTMITERKDKGLVKDDLFIADPKGQSSASLSSIPVHKSHSAVNLEHFYKKSLSPIPMLKSSDDQSPTDLVEQLFQGQPIDGVQSTSAGHSSAKWS